MPTIEFLPGLSSAAAPLSGLRYEAFAVRGLEKIASIPQLFPSIPLDEKGANDASRAWNIFDAFRFFAADFYRQLVS